MPQIVESLGLLFDIAGALWIAQGLMRLRDVEIGNAAVRGGLGGGQNKDLMRILRSSRRDAKIGGILLGLGFTGQLVATWLPR